MKKILILGASSLQVPLIKKAKALGCYTIVLDSDKNAPGATLADTFHPFSTLDINKALEVAESDNIAGIITTSDYPVRVVAQVAERFNLNGPSVSAAEICTDKWLQRNYLKRAQLSYPRFVLLESYNIESLRHMSLPLMVKPVDSSASRGVQKITSNLQLEDAFKAALHSSKSGKVIVEEYIEGKEFSVEVLVQDKKINIIAVTEKITSGESDLFFVEEVHLVPANLPDDVLLKIEKTIEKFLVEIDLDNSAAHVEVKVNSSGVYIIEAAARLGGDFITSDLVPLATGVDMLKEVILISLGDKIDIQKTSNCFAGIHFLTPENYDRAVEHLRFKIDKKSLIRSEIEDKKIRPLKSSLDRLGYFIVKANDRSELNEAIFF